MTSGFSKRKFIKTTLAGIGGLGYLLNSPFTSRASEWLLGDPTGAGQTGGLWKWSREAMFYVQTPKGIKCQICPNNCVLKPGETGDCRTRKFIDSKLYTIAYGNPCAVHEDPIEKKPLYHFLPGSRAFSIATAGCNLSCLNCQNWDISQSSPEQTRNFDLMPEAVVEQCLASHCESIAYTYSDPVAFYEYTHDTAALAREKGIFNILVSAGYIHEGPLREWCRYIDAANIDLKSFRNEIYEMLNAGTLEPVLNTLKILKEEGIWLEITNLIVPGWTDDLDMIREMCEWLFRNGFSDSPLHFSRFYPQYKLTNLPATPTPVLEKARDIAISEGIKYVYIGNVPGNDAENTFCPECNRMIVERKGFRILSNHISQGRCSFCGAEIAGRWNK
ncbi:MAG: AmmeMemoRadiSam system radical SAM enzyme [Bacteroidales bacterium]|nr:AmmeMemoRadiSam system radical SAM enzyme [Bacteroidales bacterium]